MAANFQVLSGLTTTQLIGATETLDVELYTVQAIPSGVVFYVRIPVVTLDTGIFEILAANEADLYNRIAALNHVVGVSMFENITPSNQITDQLVLTIRSTSGKTTVTREDPSFNLDPVGMQEVVDGIVAQLDAIEGL